MAMSFKSGWGAIIQGAEGDLADWERHLTEGFDPYVDRHKGDVILRSARLDAQQDAEEVRGYSIGLIDWLNGAMSIAHGTEPVHFSGVAELAADGAVHRTVFPATAYARGRGIAHGVGAALGPDGQQLPPPPPRPSQSQRWVAIAENSNLLGDALMYVGRPANWIDIYKALECLKGIYGNEAQWRRRNGLRRTKLTF
jgi:hypothetical protein